MDEPIPENITLPAAIVETSIDTQSSSTPVFNKIPVELRDEILKLAFFDVIRDVNIESEKVVVNLPTGGAAASPYKPTERIIFRSSTRNPAVLHVCRDWRYAALEYYSLAFETDAQTWSCAPSAGSRSAPQIYINWEVDRLVIMKWNQFDQMAQDLRRQCIANKLQRLAFNGGQESSRHSDSTMAIPKLMCWASWLTEIPEFTIFFCKRPTRNPSHFEFDAAYHAEKMESEASWQQLKKKFADVNVIAAGMGFPKRILPKVKFTRLVIENPSIEHCICHDHRNDEICPFHQISRIDRDRAEERARDQERRAWDQTYSMQRPGNRRSRANNNNPVPVNRRRGFMDFPFLTGLNPFHNSAHRSPPIPTEVSMQLTQLAFAGPQAPTQPTQPTEPTEPTSPRSSQESKRPLITPSMRPKKRAKLARRVKK